MPRTAFAVVLLAAGLSVAADTQLTAEEHTQGWQLLFDGKDVSAWTMRNGRPLPATAIQDGALNPHMTPRARMIYAKGKYADFVLSCDYKMSKGCNSGIFVRVGDPQNEVQTGLEIQVEDTAGQETPGKNDGGALYDILAPSKNVIKPAGQWNHCEITADKNVIKVALNGEEVINADLDKYTTPGKNLDGGKNKYRKAIKDFPREGLIGLQDHGHDCWYKNIKIKVLK